MVRFASLILTLLFALDARAAGSDPEIVFPASSPGEEVFRGSFSPDGTVFYFFRKTKTNPAEYRIFSSRLTAGGWSSPELVLLDGDHSNTYPAIAPDGRRMVFASSRPAPGMKRESSNYYLWLAERNAAGWGPARFLEALNLEGHYHSWPHFGADGRLYFRRTTPDWRTNTSLVADLDAADPAPRIDPVVERCRARRPDLRIVGGLPGPRTDVYFLDVAVPKTDDAPAHSDIWICERDGEGWEPRPLGAAINTADWETFPFFSADGRQLYFVRGFRTFHRIGMEEALSSARLPATPRDADRAALLALHEKVMRAHREGNVEMLLEDGVDDSVVGSRGAVTRPALAEQRARLGPYLRSTRFDFYRDRIAPIVRVSDDGSLGWVIVEIEAKGTQRAGDGIEAPLEFVSAWIELYEKRDGRWARTGNISNFKP